MSGQADGSNREPVQAASAANDSLSGMVTKSA